MLTVSLTDPSADLTAADHTVLPKIIWAAAFPVSIKDRISGRITIHVPGSHNIFDCLCAVGAALYSGISFDIKSSPDSRNTTAQKSVLNTEEPWAAARSSTTMPVARREIRATLKAAREVVQGELYVVFQPHTYSRTKAFFNDFVSALSLADHIVLADIYSASREKDPGDIHSRRVSRTH